MALRLLGLPQVGLHIRLLRLRGPALRLRRHLLGLLRLFQLLLLRLLDLLGGLVLRLFGMRERLVCRDHLLRLARLVESGLRRGRLCAGLAKVWPVLPWSRPFPITRNNGGAGRLGR